MSKTKFHICFLWVYLFPSSSHKADAKPEKKSEPEFESKWPGRFQGFF